MNIEKSQVEGVTVIRILGAVSRVEAVDLWKDHLQKMVQTSNQIVLDCSNCSRFDPAITASFLAVAKDLSTKNLPKLRLSGLSPAIEARLKIQKVDQVFQIYTWEYQAVESFKPKRRTIVCVTGLNEDGQSVQIQLFSWRRSEEGNTAQLAASSLPAPLADLLKDGRFPLFFIGHYNRYAQRPEDLDISDLVLAPEPNPNDGLA
jgi:anti-anti-sigma regulatory factor